MKCTFAFLALTLALTGFAASAQAQQKAEPARIRPPDLLSEPVDAVEAEAPPSNEDEEPTMAPPPRAKQETESLDPIETDKEPIPIIKKNTQAIDRRARPESRYIEHPNAKKGLIKIDKEKIYHYRVKSTEQKGAGSFKVAIYEPTNLENPEDPALLNYDSIYDDNASPLLLYEHEWQIWQKFGKFGLTATGGFFFAEGHGQFANGNSDRPKEQFMLFVFPVHVGGILRLQFADGQRLVPYGGGGVGGMAFAERRDDDLNPALGARFGFSPNATAYGGVALQLGTGSQSFLDLDREYGINKVWLTAEYRTYIHIGGDYDFSGDAINGGFTAEF